MFDVDGPGIVLLAGVFPVILRVAASTTLQTRVP
jgi:hypothetical protein